MLTLVFEKAGGRDQGQGWQNEQGIQSAVCTGLLEKIERQPMDPPILRATGPATVAGEAADRKLVKQFFKPCPPPVPIQLEAIS